MYAPFSTIEKRLQNVIQAFPQARFDIHRCTGYMGTPKFPYMIRGMHTEFITGPGNLNLDLLQKIVWSPAQGNM